MDRQSVVISWTRFTLNRRWEGARLALAHPLRKQTERGRMDGRGAWIDKGPSLGHVLH